MPKYFIEYEHAGELLRAYIEANCLEDAEARLDSLKATGELDDSRDASAEAELAARIVASARQRARSNHQPAYRPVVTKGALRPCSACRGYELERQWCGVCGRKGVVMVGGAHA